MAIQVAKAMGAKVVVTAGSQAKLNTCAALGADVLINYNDADFVEVVSKELGGVDAILDNMGAAYFERNIEALKRNGRMVIIGTQGGATTEFNILQALRKDVTISATSLRARPDNEKAAICREVEKVIWPWITDGTIKPIIDRIMPIEQAAAAQQLLENGEATGKVVLQVR